MSRLKVAVIGGGGNYSLASVLSLVKVFRRYEINESTYNLLVVRTSPPMPQKHQTELNK